MIKRLLPVALLLAACAGPGSTGPEPRLDFRSEDVQVPSELRFEGGVGEASVSGVFHAGHASARIKGELSARGEVLELRVRLVSDGVLPMVDQVPWAARVTGLQPGLYRLRVIYDYRDDMVEEVGEQTVPVQ